MSIFTNKLVTCLILGNVWVIQIFMTDKCQYLFLGKTNVQVDKYWGRKLFEACKLQVDKLWVENC